MNPNLPFTSRSTSLIGGNLVDGAHLESSSGRGPSTRMPFTPKLYGRPFISQTRTTEDAANLRRDLSSQSAQSTESIHIKSLHPDRDIKTTDEAHIPALLTGKRMLGSTPQCLFQILMVHEDPVDHRNALLYDHIDHAPSSPWGSYLRRRYPEDLNIV